MIKIYEYMLLSKEQRQIHLQLHKPCIDRDCGKNWVSVYSKGLLAYILDTTIPTGHKIQLCHACHNGMCSNPYHHYWGTQSENRLDGKANGQKNVWEYTVAKYGLEEAKKLNAKKGNKNGGGNKGKPKTEEHRKNVSEAIKLLYNNGHYAELKKNALVVKMEKASGMCG
jgi:hypothetical protein